MNLVKRTGLIAGVILTSGILVHGVSSDSVKVATKEEKTRFFPAAVDFAGESTPLHIYDVKERFDRELLVNANLHASTILVIKRANRAFEVIEPILQKYNVPDDFKYLAVIESGLVNAVSPAGARGIWQFMPATAKEMGMEVNEYVDERYHLEKSTEAACRYLLQSKERFGSWTLAAAAYNGGNTGVNRQIESQKVSNYYDLLLTEETSRYVFRILALKQIMKSPELYGFVIDKSDMYENLPTRKVEVNTSIPDLADFAIAQGINYKILKIHNPWLRDRKLVNTSGKKYIIEIPERGY